MKTNRVLLYHVSVFIFFKNTQVFFSTRQESDCAALELYRNIMYIHDSFNMFLIR